MAFSTFHLLSLTLAVDKMDGRGCSNTLLATEGLPDRSNKTEVLVI